ncbi:PRC-barrel domain-containing protein [Clostridium sp. NSJ-49]|uniref:PRC-barrel domain-containing protein n=1 Tax=Clostridium TaxID=1485 RepID=UPI00164B6E65|nr:PRC-barrel domain-containing protein [Clostridium sp. NSJ-49]MBC5623846.1 PRC-barrel domain-containing protein [Clostridium sp. NSJ-49]MDU6340516.1 PRC-barrel domain-containing protein [Clostridium sp.]
MFKTRDFYLMKVYDTNGKYLGEISDIAIDFYEGSIIGFIISSLSIFSKKNFIKKESILSLEDVLIVSSIESYKGLTFNNIKFMDVIDNKNVMKGVLEDLIIDKDTFTVKGMIISSGVIDTMFKGKEIILSSGCVLCEKFILYKGKDYIRLKTLPHNLGGIIS